MLLRDIKNYDEACESSKEYNCPGLYEVYSKNIGDHPLAYTFSICIFSLFWPFCSLIDFNLPINQLGNCDAKNLPKWVYSRPTYSKPAYRNWIVDYQETTITTKVCIKTGWVCIILVDSWYVYDLYCFYLFPYKRMMFIGSKE